jgi:niacin transporter
VIRLRSVEIALSGVFTALALAIPLFFRGTLQFVIPEIGYSATLASHVPVMLSIVVGPSVAAMVGFASTLGFLLTLGPVVAARAATHILFGVTAAMAVRRGLSYPKALFLVALPLHSIPEGLVVIPFGIPLWGALINIVGGTIHHIVDSIISIIILRSALPLIRNLRLPGAPKT